MLPSSILLGSVHWCLIPGNEYRTTVEGCDVSVGLWDGEWGVSMESVPFRKAALAASVKLVEYLESTFDTSKLEDDA